MYVKTLLFCIADAARFNAEDVRKNLCVCTCLVVAFLLEFAIIKHLVCNTYGLHNFT